MLGDLGHFGMRHFGSRTFVGTPGPGYDVFVVREGQLPGRPLLRVGVVATAAVPVVLVRARTATRTGPMAEIAVQLVSTGEGLEARPNSPRGVWAQAIAAGQVEVRWDHDDVGAAVPAASFAVYAGKLGQAGWAQVATAGQWDRSVAVAGLEAGVPWRVIVRSVSALGIEDGNQLARLVVPRDEVPPGLADGALTVIQT